MRPLRISFIALAAFLSTSVTFPLAAQTAPAPQVTIQSQFDTATEAWQKGDCAKALPIFAQLSNDKRVVPGSLPAAAIAVRRGQCLLLTGETVLGAALMEQGLPLLRGSSVDFTDEVTRSELMLGNLASMRSSHDVAQAHYRAALALLKGTDRVPALLALTQLTAFDPDNQALDAIQEGQALHFDNPAQDKSAQIIWLTMKGRVLLNRGQVKEARATLNQALKLSGGEKNRLSLQDALLRADLAQAAMLAGDRTSAYHFMAETGAGRLEKSPFTSAARLDLPDCGPDTGLTPDDRAIVEFSIDASGQVGHAQTVYTTSSYEKAAAFARAVEQWAWRPEDAAKLPDFFRSATRVEITCSRAEGMGGQSALGPLTERFALWGNAHIGPLDEKKDYLRAAEAARQAGQDDAELAARVALSLHDLRAETDQIASIDRGVALVRSGSPRIPADVGHAALVLFEAARARAARDKDLAQRRTDALLVLADDPLLAQDALAQDSALLAGSPSRPRDDRTRTDQAARTQAALVRVAQDQRLVEHHPLRQFAQLRLANAAAARGDLAKAADWFSATGLTQEQCALIGPRPALTNPNFARTSFPYEALRYGFEGWARAEFDIQADGRTAQVRTVASYPPFIFTQAARDILSAARYQSSYRPERGTACSASSDSVRFTIPGNNNTVQILKPKS